MSINDPTCIDIIATVPGSREVLLIISDHLDWADPVGHWRVLQDKINGYVGFVVQGDLARVTSPPIPASPEVRIEVRALYPAPPELQPAFDQVAAILKPMGIRFQHAHHPMPLTPGRAGGHGSDSRMAWH